MFLIENKGQQQPQHRRHQLERQLLVKPSFLKLQLIEICLLPTRSYYFIFTEYFECNHPSDRFSFLLYNLVRPSHCSYWRRNIRGQAARCCSFRYFGIGILFRITSSSNDESVCQALLNQDIINNVLLSKILNSSQEDDL